MSDTTPPAVSEAMREAVAVTRADVRDCIGPSIPLRRRWVDLLMNGPIARLQAEIARLTGERDGAEQRVTNLAAALTSAHRARGEQEQAYEGGWSDGYAEGFAKANARSDAAEADLTRMRAETERLRAALQDVADIAPEARPDHWDCELDQVCWNLSQTARAALSNQEQTDA